MCERAFLLSSFVGECCLHYIRLVLGVCMMHAESASCQCVHTPCVNVCAVCPIRRSNTIEVRISQERDCANERDYFGLT